MIEPESSIPLYQQIKDTIIADISQKKYFPNTRLPSEEELSKLYQVSRITIRRAITDLEAEAIVTKNQGKGTFVRNASLTKNFKNAAISFTELCAANGVTPSARVLDLSITEPTDPKVIEALSIPPGGKAVHLFRLRLADNRPLVLEDNYFPLQFAYLLDVDFEKQSLYSYLKDVHHIVIEPGCLVLRIERADGVASRLLEVPRNSPLLGTWGTTLYNGGAILHTCRQIGYGGDFDFVIR